MHQLLQQLKASPVTNNVNLPQQISESCATKTWLRAAGAAIPYVGGSLDIVIGHKAQSLARGRIECLSKALEDGLCSIKDDKIKYDYLESDEWGDVVIRAMERVARTRNRNRIAAKARNLPGAATRIKSNACIKEADKGKK